MASVIQLKRKTKSNPYTPMTEKEMLVKLEKSREQGACRNAADAISDMRSSSGFP